MVVQNSMQLLGQNWMQFNILSKATNSRPFPYVPAYTTFATITPSPYAGREENNEFIRRCLQRVQSESVNVISVEVAG